MRVTRLRKGKPALVTAVEHDSSSHWKKLHAFGIVPGVGIRVIQRFPALVLQVGETQIALDMQTAGLISVEEPD